MAKDETAGRTALHRAILGKIGRHGDKIKGGYESVNEQIQARLIKYLLNNIKSPAAFLETKDITGNTPITLALSLEKHLIINTLKAFTQSAKLDTVTFDEFLSMIDAKSLSRRKRQNKKEKDSKYKGNKEDREEQKVEEDRDTLLSGSAGADLCSQVRMDLFIALKLYLIHYSKSKAKKLNDKIRKYIEKEKHSVNVKNESGLTVLHLAAANNAVPFVQSLLALKETDVNACVEGEHLCHEISDCFGGTALHVSVLHGSEDMVRQFLGVRELNLDAKDHLGRTALLVAVTVNVKIAQMLITSGCDVDACDNMGANALMYACAPTLQEKDTLAMAKSLIDEGVRVNHRNNCGETALHKAAGNGTLIAIKRILDEGATVCAVTNKNETPLHYAAKFVRSEALEFLLKINPDAVFKQNSEGMTALHCACIANNIQCVKMLLEYGSLVNIIDENGETPLHHVARTGNCMNAIELVKNEADLKVVSLDNGYMPVHLAVIGNYKDLVEFFLQNGSKKSARDKNLLTPLHYATFSTGCIEPLLSAGANIDRVDSGGRTPLHIAAGLGDLLVVSYLLDAKASTSIVTVNKTTCLHYAMISGTKGVIRKLLKHTEDVNAKNNRGYTPLHYAAHFMCENIAGVELLFAQEGLDPNITDDNGDTALHVLARHSLYYINDRKKYKALLDAFFNNTKVEFCARNNAGDTPLHTAVKENNTLFVEYCSSAENFNFGKASQLLNNKGDSPIHLAMGLPDVFKIFLKNCTTAELDVRNANNCTPLYLAAQSSQTWVRQQLLEAGCQRKHTSQIQTEQ
eukprot:TRINITY_DN1187_c0_g1_i1.p1 TRINITY_DN1187_c0_g1~~TRINITY_DN1187_c0_g1_i1.p1  ORF type:complete len:910 (-),score=159.32 TRINITY_DN1187_c0_g1_i1:33-2435(-)